MEQMIQNENMPRGELKRLRQKEAARRSGIKKIGWAVGVIFIVGLTVGGGIWYGVKGNRNLPGVFYPSVGQEHIALNAEPPKPYNSNPPSSGAHYGSPANWRVYDYEVNDKIFIHNLEHGGIWIAYKPSVSAQVVKDLEAIAEEFNGSKIVMAPRSSNDSDIAVAAWSRVLKLNSVSGAISDSQKEEIRAFYRRFKNRGPEFDPDTMPGIDPRSVQ